MKRMSEREWAGHEEKRRHSVGDRTLVQEFLSAHACYDLLPISSQVIVFDVSLPLKKAFYAMLQNEIRAAPLWDSEPNCIVGMLTVTDFIDILRHYHHHPVMNENDLQLDDHSISSWKEFESKKPLQPRNLFSVNPMSNTFQAAQILIRNRIHRIPLIDKTEASPQSGPAENVVGVLTQFKILRFLATNMKDRPGFFHQTVKELGLGTYKDIATAQMSSPLIDVLDMMTKKRVSAVPIVDNHGVLLDVYEKFDVTYLARVEALKDLRMTIEKALQHRVKDLFEGVHTCLENDTLQSILDTIRQMPLHRLVVVDHAGKLCGIISLSDILSFLIADS